MAIQSNATNPERMAVVDSVYVDREDRMDPVETADMIGVLVGTLAYWRCTGRHSLAYTKVGKKIFYSRKVVEAWLAKRTGTSTAQIRAGALAIA